MARGTESQGPPGCLNAKARALGLVSERWSGRRASGKTFAPLRTTSQRKIRVAGERSLSLLLSQECLWNGMKVLYSFPGKTRSCINTHQVGRLFRGSCTVPRWPMVHRHCPGRWLGLLLSLSRKRSRVSTEGTESASYCGRERGGGPAPPQP